MTARTAAAPGARGKRVKTHARSTSRLASPSFTFFASCAKRSDSFVSCADATVGDTLTIRSVLPPAESAGRSSFVNAFS